MECFQGRAMDGDVVWMIVTTNWVGSDHHLRSDLADQVCDSACHFVDRSGG
jgi:hypothetical protein